MSGRARNGPAGFSREQLAEVMGAQASFSGSAPGSAPGRLSAAVPPSGSSATEGVRVVLGEGALADPVIRRLVAPDALKPDEAGADAVVVLPFTKDDRRLAELVSALAALPTPSLPGLLVIDARLRLPLSLPCACAIVSDTRLALARLSAALDARPRSEPGVHERAWVDDSARLGSGVSVAAGAVIGARAVIGDRSSIGENAVVGEGAELGVDCRIFPQVTIYDGVKLGDRVIVHAGAVLGADGFGYAAGPTGAEKIHHSAGLRLGNDVEIGANTAIDRGTLSDTLIGERTKIDNHCQIGHNVVIGDDCLIAGKAGIGGSTVIGNRVVIGGYVKIADHLRVHDGARLAGGSGLTKDVPAGETWAGEPARPHRRFVRELYLLDRLEEIWQATLAARRAAAGADGGHVDAGGEGGHEAG